MKIIGSDYDGTLNHDGIDDKKLKAIDKWREAGNIFALISGRGPGDILEIYKEKQFGFDYLVADNGAVILKPDGEIVSDIRCDGKIADELLKLLLESGCPWGEVHTSFPCRVYADNEMCVEDDGYTLETVPEIPYFNQISTMLDDFEEAERVTAIVKEKMGDRLNPLQNGRCIDIVRKDMDKAKGLYLLMEFVGARYDDIIAVGDNINDTDMIREFRSYAMESGVESIKELADYTTTGITELIEKELGEDNMEKRDTLEIIFIRHAETDYTDIGDRDNCDGELTERGEKQCDELGEKLKNVPIDAYITSSLLRAFKTATGVVKAKQNEPLLEICPEIIECGCTPGYFGCSEEYLKRYYKNTKMCENLFGKDKYDFGCEAKEDNIIRAGKFIDYLKNRFTFGQRVAVFSHHGMLEYLIPTALGVEPHVFRFALENISMTVVEFCRDGNVVLKDVNK